MANKWRIVSKIVAYLDLWSHCILVVASVVLCVLTIVLHADPAPNTKCADKDITDFYLFFGTLSLFGWIYGFTANRFLSAFITGIPTREAQRRIKSWKRMKILAVFLLIIAGVVSLIAGFLQLALVIIVPCLSGNLLFLAIVSQLRLTWVSRDVDHELSSSEGDDVSSEGGYASSEADVE